MFRKSSQNNCNELNHRRTLGTFEQNTGKILKFNGKKYRKGQKNLSVRKSRRGNRSRIVKYNFTYILKKKYIEQENILEKYWKCQENLSVTTTGILVKILYGVYLDDLFIAALDGRFVRWHCKNYGDLSIR